jgi:hypothetical protein
MSESGLADMNDRFPHSDFNPARFVVANDHSAVVVGVVDAVVGD